jgi:hypothetical protein
VRASVATANPGRLALVVNIRRIECILLLSAAALLLFSSQMPPLAILPLIVTALTVYPRKPTLTETRTERRKQFVAFLEQQAEDLRKVHFELSQLPVSMQRAQMLWQVERQISEWIASAESQFRAFPEFKAIFEAHHQSGAPVYELDSCLARLAELRRLCSLSQKLKLPI